MNRCHMASSGLESLCWSRRLPLCCPEVGLLLALTLKNRTPCLVPSCLIACFSSTCQWRGRIADNKIAPKHVGAHEARMKPSEVWWKNVVGFGRRLGVGVRGRRSWQQRVRASLAHERIHYPDHEQLKQRGQFNFRSRLAQTPCRTGTRVDSSGRCIMCDETDERFGCGTTACEVKAVDFMKRQQK